MRMRGFEDHARIFAVGIRHDELELLRRRRAVDRHIGDARREGAPHAQNVLVDRIAHAMGGIAKRGLRAREALRGERLPV